METKDLILEKAQFSDWEALYRNVWSRPESARYMLWRLTTNETDAQARMERTLVWQAEHDSYTVFEKASGQAIGFAGVEQVDEITCEEAGICLGPDFTGKGYGKQILRCLMEYCRNHYGARVFLYSTRQKNEASRRLAAAFGFELVKTEERLDDRDGSRYILEFYRKEL